MHEVNVFKFWTEAFHIAVYIISHLPMLILNDLSPYEVLYPYTPCSDDLSLFRCIYYVHIGRNLIYKFENMAILWSFLAMLMITKDIEFMSQSHARFICLAILFSIRWILGPNMILSLLMILVMIHVWAHPCYMTSKLMWFPYTEEPHAENQDVITTSDEVNRLSGIVYQCWPRPQIKRHLAFYSYSASYRLLG